MNGYTHMVVGGLTGGLAIATSVGMRRIGVDVMDHTLYPLLGIIPAVIGGLGPDIDMPQSKAGKAVRKGMLLAIVATGMGLIATAASVWASNGTWNSIVPLGIFFLSACGLMLFIATSKHRRETHSGLMALVLLVPFFWMLWGFTPNLMTNVLLSVWGGFWLGWMSHLAADSFNKKGVPWLFPFAKNERGNHKHYSIMSVVTGSEGETYFQIITSVVMCIIYILIIFIGRSLT